MVALDILHQMVRITERERGWSVKQFGKVSAEGEEVIDLQSLTMAEYPWMLAEVRWIEPLWAAPWRMCLDKC